MDCNPPGSSVHEIFQARILEWVVISFSRGSSQPRDWTQVSCTAGKFCTDWATREALDFCILILYAEILLNLFILIAFRWHLYSFPYIVLCHLHIWGYWYFSQQSWFQFVLHSARYFAWCCSSVGKEFACSAGDLSSIPGLGRSPGEGSGCPVQYPCLENLMDRGARWTAVHGVAKSRARLSD